MILLGEADEEGCRRGSIDKKRSCSTVSNNEAYILIHLAAEKRLLISSYPFLDNNILKLVSFSNMSHQNERKEAFSNSYTPNHFSILTLGNHVKSCNLYALFNTISFLDQYDLFSQGNHCSTNLLKNSKFEAINNWLLLFISRFLFFLRSILLL